MRRQNEGKEADICLIVEGAYPYISGGVSSWLHNLIQAQDHLSFSIISLMPSKQQLKIKYELPKNVFELNNIYLCDIKEGNKRLNEINSICKQLEKPLIDLQKNGGLFEISQIIRILSPFKDGLGKFQLLNSEAAWKLLLHMYQSTIPSASFLNYFWSWRSLLGSLYATMISPMPRAKVYHTISTGYAGLFAARAKLETGRPVILTEHGIYTNERRIEVMMADWFSEGIDEQLIQSKNSKTLRNVWIDAFQSYTNACYSACDLIITLYQGNQKMQLRDGADPKKLKIIPNGVDFDIVRKANISRSDTKLTVALIGRVVPIKDVKTYIRACNIVLDQYSELQVLIIGPTDEDPVYYQECKNIINQLECENKIKFTGQVNLDNYFNDIDILVLTSISEAQPLVILEAGAVGIPSVVTDVGACREMILGRNDEVPKLGPGGVVTSLASPISTANGMLKLLSDNKLRKGYGENIRKRVKQFYQKKDINSSYRKIYSEMMLKKTNQHIINQEYQWRA